MRNLNLLLFGLLFIVVSSCKAQTNLLEGMVYSVSEKPNYKYTNTDQAGKILTDGRMQSSVIPTFWTNKQSLGWQNKDRIIIDFDLGKLQDFTKVTLNTAVGKSARVSLPSNILVFSST